MSLISDEPIQLVSLVNDKWVLNEKARSILFSLTKPIKVLSIAGRYRSGKSYILNQLLDVKKGGFELGHTTKGCTKGIWMWGMDTGEDIVLALDTEGLSDTQNDAEFDSKLYSLVLMLSSYVVINVTAVLDENLLNHLSFVTRLSKIIFEKETDEEEDDGTCYKEIFPPVMFLIRDFQLSIPDGKTPEDYLSDILKNTSGLKKQHKEKNEIRDAIIQSFPVREIMTIPVPHAEAHVVQNIQDHYDDLSPAFNKSVDAVCKKLTNCLKTKRVKFGDENAKEIQNGEEYFVFAEAIVTGMNSKGRIEIPNLFQAVCDVERRNNLQRGNEMLRKSFQEISENLPLDETDLIDRLTAAQNGVIEQVTQNVSDRDTRAIVADELDHVGNQMQENVLADNREKSRKVCKDIKTKLVEDLRKSCNSHQFQSVESFEEKKQESVLLLQKQGVGPTLKDVLTEFDDDCVHLREILYTQLKLQKIEIDAAESSRKAKENEVQLELMKKENEERDKQAKIREDALKAQNEALAKKFDEDIRRWNEEKDQMQKQFQREIEQAKRANDSRSADIAQQQYESYSARSPASKKYSGKKIWVNSYCRNDGTKVSGYYRKTSKK